MSWGALRNIIAKIWLVRGASIPDGGVRSAVKIDRTSARDSGVQHLAMQPMEKAHSVKVHIAPRPGGQEETRERERECVWQGETMPSIAHRYVPGKSSTRRGPRIEAHSQRTECR